MECLRHFSAHKFEFLTFWFDLHLPTSRKSDSPMTRVSWQNVVNFIPIQLARARNSKFWISIPVKLVRVFPTLDEPRPSISREFWELPMTLVWLNAEAAVTAGLGRLRTRRQWSSSSFRRSSFKCYIPKVMTFTNHLQSATGVQYCKKHLFCLVPQ